MGVFTRGKALWIRFRDADGKWRNASTGYSVGQEALAEATHVEVLARVRAATASEGVDTGPLTLRAFAARWLDSRETETVEDDRGRIDNHILPAIGDIAIAALRPRHVRAFVESLSQKKKLGNKTKDGSRVATDELLAPRTVRHVYATLRAMLNDAVADELIPSSPCVLKDELPEKKDKDRTWRRTAVFVRDEVQTIISAPAASIPEDRRVMYAIMFLGAMRFGECAALTWRDYDATIAPLGRLVIEKSYSSKSRKVKGTKTENPREMPVHPTLARILADWKLGGFERSTGRRPSPDDLIVPSRRGAPRNANHMLRRFHEDLDRVGLRERRQHDTRRTFISIARADGARADVLRTMTHGATGDIVDSYTTLPWATLCEEVAKVRIEVIEGKLIELPIAVGSTQLVTSLVTAMEPVMMTNESWRSGRDLNPRPPA